MEMESNNIPEDLQQYLSQLMHERNNRAIPDFESYSPIEMTRILYRAFEEGSPITLLPLDEVKHASIPLMNQIRYLAKIISEQGELKLTQKGNLPTKVVADLCRLEPGTKESRRPIKPLMKESDSIAAALSRMLLDLAGITKKRSNKLSLTKAGEKLLANNDQLLKKILHVYCYRFNWGYFDLYNLEQIGQMGFGFSLVLLSKWGDKKRVDSFYADKYFTAYPFLINDSIQPSFGSVQRYVTRAYSLRTFDRFLMHFGLVEVEKENWDADTFIRKSDLFDKLIKCIPPENKV